MVEGLPGRSSNLSKDCGVWNLGVNSRSMPPDAVTLNMF